MLELFRDTVIGHLLRWLSHGKLLPHAEDVDPSLWRMYVSTDKSTDLEHLVVEENRRKSISSSKRLKRRGGKRRTRKGITPTSSKEQKADNAATNQTITDIKEPSSRSCLAEAHTEESEAKTRSENDKDEDAPVGGDVGTAGIWNNEEVQQTWADYEKDPGGWSHDNTPATQSNVETPRDGSSTALVSYGSNAATRTPQDKDLEQGWVTAALGQEGQEVSVQQGQVDGDPALQLHSEGTDPAWNAVQLEVGEQEVHTAEKVKEDPATDRVVNVVVWFGPDDPGASQTNVI